MVANFYYFKSVFIVGVCSMFLAFIPVFAFTSEAADSKDIDQLIEDIGDGDPIGNSKLMSKESPKRIQRLPDSHEVRSECRKGSDMGCTGHLADVCKSAPLGFMIVGRSVQLPRPHAYGKAIRCIHSLKGEKIIEDWTGPIKLYKTICMTSHIESGGGGGNIGTIFFNKCRANYDVVTKPKN